MKFGQLIEYSIINIFLEKLYVVVQNVVEKLVPEPFIKHRMSISESTVRKVIKFVFIVCPSRSLPKKYHNSGAGQLPLPYIKLFQKTKRGLELVFLPCFLHDF